MTKKELELFQNNFMIIEGLLVLNLYTSCGTRKPFEIDEAEELVNKVNELFRQQEVLYSEAFNEKED